MKRIGLGLLAALMAAGSMLSATPVFAESLVSAQARAYETHPQIASAYIAVRSARENIRLTEGGTLPTIGGAAQIGVVNQAGLWNPTDSIGLSYEQTIFDNNQTAESVRAAQAQLDAAIFAAQSTEQNVLLAATQAYINVVAFRRIVEIRRETVGFLEAQVGLARERVELGEALQLDVSQAEVRLAQANAGVQGALNSLRSAEANYERWVGRAPGSLTGSYNFSALMPPSLETALNRAVTSHPALLARDAQFRAAQFDYQSTLNAAGPSVSFSGQAGLGGFTSGQVNPSASFGLRLAIPIYAPQVTPGREIANLQQIDAQLQGLVTEGEVREAVRQGWSGVEAAGSQILSSTAAVAASRLALDAVLEQNELGLTTTLDVLNQRSELASAEETLVSAQAERALAAYSLVAATGALNARVLGLPVQHRAADGGAIVGN